MSTEGDLYQAILARRSVRRYAPAPLGQAGLEQVQRIVAGVQPLTPGNRFEVLLRTCPPGEDLVATLGGYGQIINPPHYLLPYAVGEAHLLTDLGYRVEQIAVRLAGMGLGSCFVGCLGREAAVRAAFDLPEGVRIGAFLVFGRPSAALGGRAVNAVIRSAAGASNKLPAERIFFQGGFDSPAVPGAELAPLIEAARHAPSAGNAQPWRLLWHDGQLHLFVKRHNLRYGGGARSQYKLYDGGICMGNVALALEALGMEGHWALYGANEPGIPDHPASLRPLARLILRGELQEARPSQSAGGL